MATQITHKVGDVLENGKVVSEVDDKGRVLVVKKNGNGDATPLVGKSVTESAKAAAKAKRAAKKPAPNAKAVAEKVATAKRAYIIRDGKQVAVKAGSKAASKPAPKPTAPKKAAKPKAKGEYTVFVRTIKDVDDAEVKEMRKVLREKGRYCDVALKFRIPTALVHKLLD